MLGVVSIDKKLKYLGYYNTNKYAGVVVVRILPKKHIAGISSKHIVPSPPVSTNMWLDVLNVNVDLIEYCDIARSRRFIIIFYIFKWFLNFFVLFTWFCDVLDWHLLCCATFHLLARGKIVFLGVFLRNKLLAVSKAYGIVSFAYLFYYVKY